MTNRNRTILGSTLAAGVALMILWKTAPAPAPTGGPSRVAAPAVADGAAPPSTPVHEIASLEEQLKTSPDHAPILLRLADLKRQTGKPEEAVKHLREALKTDPGNSEARLELGRSLYESGDIPGAIAETQAILERNPDHVDALYNIGAIYGNAGKDDMARQFWTRAVAADANSDSGQKAKAGLAQLAVPGEHPPALPANHPPMAR
ncbi:MAG: tetratricopeptide repeat protein [Bryobacteraceae bacterium]